MAPVGRGFDPAPGTSDLPRLRAQPSLTHPYLDLSVGAAPRGASSPHLNFNTLEGRAARVGAERLRGPAHTRAPANRRARATWAGTGAAMSFLGVRSRGQRLSLFEAVS